MIEKLNIIDRIFLSAMLRSNTKIKSNLFNVTLCLMLLFVFFNFILIDLFNFDILHELTNKGEVFKRITFGIIFFGGSYLVEYIYIKRNRIEKKLTISSLEEIDNTEIENIKKYYTYFIGFSIFAIADMMIYEGLKFLPK